MQASKVFDYGTVYQTTFKIIMSILTELIIIITYSHSNTNKIKII